MRDPVGQTVGYFSSIFVVSINQSNNQSINQSYIFRVVQVIKSLQDPLEVGNNHNNTGDQ